MWSNSSLPLSSFPLNPPLLPSTAVKRMANIVGPFSIAESSPTMASGSAGGSGAKRPFTPSAITTTRMADSMAGPSSFSSSARQPPSVTFLSSSGPATAAAAEPNTGSASTSVFNLAFTPSSTRTKDNIFAVPRSRAPQQQQQLRTPLPSTPRSITFPTPITMGGGGQQTPRTGTGTLPRSRHSDNVIAAAVNGRGFAKNEVGLAAFNLTSYELHLCQMSDSHGFIKTMAKMNLFRPNEVLMPDTTLIDSSRSLLADCISRFDSDILLTSVNRGAFSDAVGIQFIQKLAVPDHLSVLHLVDQKYYALAAAAALLAHLENNLNLNFAAGTLRVFYSGTNQTAIVDSETSHRLELVSSLNPSGGPSLLSALNYCQTAAGSRLLRSNLLEPMTDLRAINQRLDAVEELAARPTDFHHPVTEILGRFVDVERAVNQCIVTPKNPNWSFIEQRINAVIALKHILTLVPPLLQVLSKSRCSFLVALVKDLDQKKFEELLGKIQNVVDDRTRAVKGKMGQQKQRLQVIKKGVNLMLDVCRKTHCDLEVKIEEYVEELAEKYQMPLTLSNTATRGYHLQQPCGRGSVGNTNRQSSSSSRNSLRAAASTSSDHQSQELQLPPIFICVKRHGNYIAFTTQQLLVSNERIKAVQKDVEKITNAIVEELLATIRTDISSLYKLRDIVCQLDVVASFAQVSFAGGFCRPSYSQQLLICDGRHPILNRFSPGALISNDTDVDEERSFVVITGANMSGKSTYIRQVMLLQIMSQIGCFVPASSASFRIVDQMFSRLCTHDRIENNASSFSLEMMEMNYIVRNADERSLVIIDELCRETSVDQGSAISWSLCEALMAKRAWVLIATHSPLITKMQDMYFNVVNYHMEVIEEERRDGPPALNYTHKILPGVSTLENYGMKLARQAALPAQVLARAEELIPILAAAIKPQPQVPFDFMMDKLHYSLNIRLLDVSRRMDSIPEASLRVELDHIRANYQQELSQLLTDYGFSMSES